MITLAKGLSNSLIVLEILRQDEEFCSKHSIGIGTFTNCREQGLTFILTGMYENGEYIPCIKDTTFTWCIYEHRNSDCIIINGKPGYVTFNGDLPYKADDKYIYIDEFGCGKYDECAERLKELITEKAIIATHIYYKEHPAKIV